MDAADVTVIPNHLEIRRMRSMRLRSADAAIRALIKSTPWAIVLDRTVLLLAFSTLALSGCSNKSGTAGSSTGQVGQSGSSPDHQRPTEKVAEHPFQASLPSTDSRAWHTGAKYVPLPAPQLTAQESRISAQVTAAGGRFSKRAIPDGERRVIAKWNAKLPSDGWVAVEFDRMQSAGKLAAIDDLHGVIDMNLSRSNVTDDDVEQLARADDLIILDLNFTHVTDRGLAYLAGLKNLRMLVLDNADVTSAGVEKLRQANPRLRILHGASDSQKLDPTDED